MRAPLQIIIIPYRNNPGGGFEFAVFHRADGSMWHFVSGGAEDDETSLETAERELLEETGIEINARRPLLKLEAQATVPRTAFPHTDHWPDDLLVVPEFSFAVDITGCQITLSDEHDEVRWLDFTTAHKLLTWDSNRVALWELHERLK